jgi:hypothetical protein
VIVVTGDWDCNKEITNPNGVSSGVRRTIGVQNWSSTPTLYNIFSLSFHFLTQWVWGLLARRQYSRGL